jgi:hypothetical protein
MRKNIMERSNKRNTFYQELKGSTNEITSQIRQLIKKGNARRLMIQNKKGKILFQTQLTAGLAGSTLHAFMAPIISALGMFALVMNDVKVVVEKYPDEELTHDEYEVEAEVIVEVNDEDDETKTNKTIGKEDK